MKGKSYELIEDEISIGRSVSNQICINDNSLSRRHCLIRRDGETFRVIDLESSNGTFINAKPIGEQSLKHGDQIAIGSVLFLFMADEVEVAERKSAVEFSDEDVARHSTIQLERKDAIYLKPAAVASRLSAETRIASDLAALLKITTSLSKLRELGGLQRVLLETVLNAIPAERGAILLVKENTEELFSSYSLDKKSQKETPVAISRSVAKKVLSEATAILCTDTSKDFHSAESLIADSVEPCCARRFSAVIVLRQQPTFRETVRSD